MRNYLLLIGMSFLFFTLIPSTNAYVLSGYVFNSSGYPLANIPMELVYENKTTWLKNITNGNGYFKFISLAKGLYELDINEKEEVIDCKLRNEVPDCNAINNKAVCENSYTEYCSACNLPEGECAYFPCFWGDVGEGYKACYYYCDQCLFGINQTILINYTTVTFENENMINLTDDLEINSTLLKIDAKLEFNASIFKNGDVIKANVTAKNNENFNLINWGAAFGIWVRGYEEDKELYFNFTPTNLSGGQKKSYIFTYKILENNTYDEFYPFGGIGTFNWSVKSSKGNLTALIHKLDEKEIFIGKKTKFNISLKKGWNLVSVPVVLINPILPAPFESIEGNYSHGFAYINGTWYSYYAGEPPNNKYIEPKMGFWINMTNDDVLEVEGYEPNRELDLNQGWNLIGYPSLNEMNTSDIVDYLNLAIVYSYNGSWSSYVADRTFNSLNTMKPGYGYWVKAK